MHTMTCKKLGAISVALHCLLALLCKGYLQYYGETLYPIQALLSLWAIPSALILLPLVPIDVTFALGFTAGNWFSDLLGPKDNVVTHYNRRIVIHKIGALSYAFWTIYSIMFFILSASYELGVIPLFFSFLASTTVWISGCCYLWNPMNAQQYLKSSPVRFLTKQDMPIPTTSLTIGRFRDRITATTFRISDTLNKVLVLTENGYFVYTSNWDFVVSKLEYCRGTIVDAASLLMPETSQAESVNQLLTVRFEFSDEINEPLQVPLTNAMFQELLASEIPIEIPENITLLRSAADTFTSIFAQAVAQNPRYNYEDYEELDHCLGCFARRPNVKLIKRCDDDYRVRQHFLMATQENIDNIALCQQCECRPAWCVSCLARVFYSKQTCPDRSQWINGFAPCPTCRRPFCVDDVSRLMRKAGDKSDDEDN